MDRTCEPMNKNWIRGVVSQGERAGIREALVTKGMWRRSSGCAGTESVLTWGDLALRLKGRRVHPEREVSKGRTSRVVMGPMRPKLTVKDRTRRTVTSHVA